MFSFLFFRVSENLGKLSVPELHSDQYCEFNYAVQPCKRHKTLNSFVQQCCQVGPYIRTWVLNKDLLEILGPYYVCSFNEKVLILSKNAIACF